MKHALISLASILVGVSIQAQDLGGALNTNLTWTTGGYLWVAETNVTLDGLAAQSGGPITTVGPNSWLQTTVTNTGYLFFSWKANLSGYWDYGSYGHPHRGGRLDLNLNGNLDRTSYGTDWAPQFLYCNAASTTVQWVLYDENNYSSGTDQAWLDEVTFLPDPSGPQMWSQPQPVSSKVAEGTTVSFSATAIGTPPLVYQWQKDGVPIPGATNTTLTLSNVVLTQSGAYDLFVTNISGSVTSSNATLQVVPRMPLSKISEWPGYERGATESVAVNGNLIYVGNEDWDTYGAFLVLDGSNPANPVLIGKLEGTQHGFNHLRVVGNYVYAGLDSNGGVTVIDVSNPAQPQVITNLALGEITGMNIAGNYAYVIGNSGLVILDISQPAAPVVVSTLSPVCYPQDVSVMGNTAYVVGRCGGSLAVLDITTPTNPVVLATLALNGPADKIEVTNNTAYIGTWNNFQVVDVSNPTNPMVMQVLPSGYVAHGNGNRIYAGSGDNLMVYDASNPTNLTPVVTYNLYDYPENFQIVGNLIYIANWEHGLTIVDISNSAQPNTIGNFASGVTGGGIEVVGNLAFLADADGGLQIFDASNPLQPVTLGRYWTPSDLGPIQLKVARNLAYIPYYSAGLRIVDVSDPAHPVLAGVCTNVYAEWVDLAGNYAYVGTGAGGLKVVDISDPTHPTAIVQTNVTVGTSLFTIAGNYLYLAPWYESTVMTVDISNPTQPVAVSDNAFASQPWNFFVQNNQLFADGQIGDLSNPTNPIVVGQYGNRGYVQCIGNNAFIADGYGLSVYDFSVPPTVQIAHTNLMGWSQAVKIAGQYAFVADMDWGLQVFQLPTNFITAPALLPWPTNETVFAGNNFALSANASGQPPLTYQWYLNGAPIPSETNWALSFPQIQTASAGNYSVIVSNSVGAVTNQTTLTVIVRPTIVTGGTNQFGFSGPGQFTFAFRSQTNAEYAVEYVTSLADTNWVTLTNIWGTDLPIQFTDLNPTNVSRFYRIRKE